MHSGTFQTTKGNGNNKTESEGTHTSSLNHMWEAGRATWGFWPRTIPPGGGSHIHFFMWMDATQVFIQQNSSNCMAKMSEFIVCIWRVSREGNFKDKWRNAYHWDKLIFSSSKRVPWTARSKQSILSRSVLGVHWKDWCWSWNSNTLATSYKELTHWKRPWCWEGLGAGEGDDRGWDGWMASPTRWTCVWVNSGSWWRTGRPGVLPFMGSQRVRHDWATELNWTEVACMAVFAGFKILKGTSNLEVHRQMNR